MCECCRNEAKKGEIDKMFLRWRFDVCALSETKLNGKGELMFGEVVYRAREGVALLLSGRLMRCVVKWKEVSSRLMWVRVKIERERELGVYIGGKSEEEIEEFWNELSECVRSFASNKSLVVLGDFNARVGKEVIEGIVGRHGVPGRNESCDRLQEMCAEQS